MLLLLLACADGVVDKALDSNSHEDDTGAPDTDTGDTDTGPGDTDTGPGDTDSGDTGPGDTDTGEPFALRMGTFTTWDDVWPDGWAYFQAPAVGDIDGDGVDELLFYESNATDAFHLVAYDAYAGTFELLTTFRGNVSATSAAIVGDQIVLVTDDDGAFVFTGIPTTAVTLLADAPTTIAGAEGVASAGDLDGDGVLDLAARFATTDWALFAGPLPAGTVTEDAARVHLDTSYVTSLTPGDFDGDGLGDLLVSSGVTNSVLFGPIPDGEGTAEALGAVALELVEPWRMGSVDVFDDGDGDGRDDIVIQADYGVLLFGGLDRAGGALQPDVVLEGPENPQVLPDAVDDGAGDRGLAFTIPNPRRVAIWHGRPTNADVVAVPDVVWEDGALPDWVRIARLGGPARADVLYCADGEIRVGRGYGPPGADADRDGYAADDCDDADATVHPRAAERADGRDEDCDGAVDDGVGRIVTIADPALAGGYWEELGADVAAWDDDGDGVESLVVVGADALTVYDMVGGAVGEGTATRTGVAALATVVLGDVDGDGVANLGAANAVGGVLREVWILPTAPTGSGSLFDDATVGRLGFPNTESDAGTTVSAVGDIDGDGLADVFVGGSSETSGTLPSTVYLFYGGALAERAGADADVSFAAPEGTVQGTRRATPVGDLDGDGRDDLAFTTGRGVHVVVGVAGGAGAWDAAATVLDVPDERLAAGDLDEDGADELYVADASARRVTGFDLPLAAGTLDATDARVTITAADESSLFGAALAVGAGASGPLLVVGDPSSAGNGYDAGRVWAFAGPLDGALDEDAAVAGWQGAAPGDRVGTSLTFLDVAGTASLALGVPSWDGDSGYEGGVVIVGSP